MSWMVVRIPLEDDGILRVYGERTQGVVKTLMNAKVDELKLSDISVVRDFIDVFPEDLSMTTAMTRPFEILERIGLVADRLRLPEELSYIKVDKTLRFVEEPVKNSGREVKRLKCSRMVVVKVHLGSKFLMSLLDDGRGSGSWMFLFIWSGYAAMRTLYG
ncbi:hypothetical protein Tco_0410475 [Tanacetum coccineum]